MPNKKLWLLLVGVLIVSFSILGFFGKQVYRQAPPIPDQVVSESGEVLYTKEDIQTGQMVWQSIGGQQLGSVWGHGAYQAPDWTADWLHKELLAAQGLYAQKQYGADFAALSEAQQQSLISAIKTEYRTNTFKDGIIVYSDTRAEAFKIARADYVALFSGDPSAQALREAYAIQDNIIPDQSRIIPMMAFFNWTSWSAATNRPGETYTYTNNWPHEDLIGNVPTTGNLFWSLISVFLLIGGTGALLWYFTFRKNEEEIAEHLPEKDPLAGFAMTPSMKAVTKYGVVAVALFIVQIFLGAVTAHYTVEGQHFFGFPLSHYLPYSLSRTWHLQTAVFWIATAFLSAGLFLGPLIHGGKDPKYQRLGVNVLFGALLMVVAGSLFGEWMAIHQKFSLNWSFWLGQQGYEYVDLGRVWQIALLVGLVLWLILMLRCIVPALKKTSEHKEILVMFTGASAAIGLFYASGLFYGAKTHLSVMEYWRWWVVHLWVEGFFEVFATVAIAFIFTKLGLLRVTSATRAVLLAASLFLIGGIPGTFHHLYFSGTPLTIMAIGACFSALEVIPLVLIGLEAFQTYRLKTITPWMNRLKWPIHFFVGVAFWNLVGAGLFGFLINPPIALFYMQGLNTTAVHAHTALFGVYGLLSLGLITLVIQYLHPSVEWNEKMMRFGFWGMNIGLALMVLLSLLPIGLIQTWASIEHGLWYARSAELLQQPLLQNLRWMRIIGDGTFILSALSFATAIVMRVAAVGKSQRVDSL